MVVVKAREEALASEIVIGAFDGNQLIGVAGVYFETRTKLKHKSHLFGMYIKPYARQHGIGKKLVAAVIQEARSRPNIEIMQLTVSNENTAARTLYENFGFTQFGLEPLAVCKNPGIYVLKIYMWLKIRNPD